MYILMYSTTRQRSLKIIGACVRLLNIMHTKDVSASQFLRNLLENEWDTSTLRNIHFWTIPVMPTPFQMLHSTEKDEVSKNYKWLCFFSREAWVKTNQKNAM
jgi:hypothetical protein